VLSSYISLIAGFRALFEHDIDRDQIAREQLEVWASGAESAIEVRRQRDPKQFFDLYFHDYVADPIGSVRRIYAHFGLDLSEGGERRLADWESRSSKAKHGKHRHSMEDVDLSREETLERFSAYMDFVGIEPE
jgi:hypothetical protein